MLAIDMTLRDVSAATLSSELQAERSLILDEVLVFLGIPSDIVGYQSSGYYTES